MKKLFISIIALFCAITMSAQLTADVTLKLKSQSGSVCELYMFAGPDMAATPERGSFMANASNPEDVNIYAIDPVNSNSYSSFGNETLENIPVAIITSKEAAALQNYTILFEVYQNAEVLKLTDLVTGTETNITNGGSYAFTIAAATDPAYVEGSYSTIADRFMINYNPEQAICFKYDKLELTKYKGAKVEVFAKDATTPVASETIASDVKQLIDLSAQAAGRYIVKIDLDADPATTADQKEYQIDVKPTVTEL